MHKIRYPQDRPRLAVCLIPILFFPIGIAVGFTNWKETDDFMESCLSLIPGAAIILISGIIFVISMRRAAKDKKWIMHIRNSGKKYPGQILLINSHRNLEHSSQESAYTVFYTYSFRVQYMDPRACRPIIAESIETGINYPLSGNRCNLYVLGNNIIVDEAEVDVPEFRRQRFRYWLPRILLCVVIIFGIVMCQLQ